MSKFFLYKTILALVFFQSSTPLSAHSANLLFPEGYHESANQVDSQTQKLLSKINQSPPKFREMPIEKLERIAKAEFSSKIVHSNIESIEKQLIEGPNGQLPLRIYKPKATGPLPVFIFLHGGGWTAGNLKHYDHLCQEICHQANCLLIAVEYGQAPQYTYPQPLDDCYFAAEWVQEHAQEIGGNPKQIAIGGDSAGGNLAAAVTLKARESQTLNFICQVLICPILHYHFDTPSYFQFSERYFLSRKDMKFFWNNYLSHTEDRVSPFISPLIANSLSQLPPAFILIANFDPLRDEALAYALRLYKEGVSTEVKRFDSIHGFYCYKDLEVTKQAVDFISLKLQKEFSKASFNESN